jgi:hypothetical protein
MSYIKTLLENANCIIPKNKKSGALWLGNYKSALDPVFLKDNEISVIINCTIDLPYIYDILDQEKHGLSKLQTFRIPVYDSLLEHDIIIMEQYLSTALPFTLEKLLKEHKNVLIHCYAGKQRSGSLCAATLFILVDNDILTLKSKNDEIINIDNKSKLMNKIIEYMLEKRPCVFTYGFRVNFKKSLERFFNIKL